MDFKTLSASGNIAFYNSCEVTEIFLYRKSDKAIFNFFTLAVFEEKAYNGLNKIFLGDRISVNDDFSIGIQRYWLSVTEAEIRFDILKNQNKWSANSTIYSQFPQLKYLPKQYIPSVEGNRINHILKNNYHNGSYSIDNFEFNKNKNVFVFGSEGSGLRNNITNKCDALLKINISKEIDSLNVSNASAISLYELYKKNRP